MKRQTITDSEASGQRMTQADLHQWRLQLLNGLLLTIFAIGSPLVVLSSLNALNTQPAQAPIVITLFITIYIIIGMATFIRKIPYVLRVIILLLLLYTLGFMDIFAYGLVSDGRIYASTVALFAALLLGMRPAVLATMIASGTLLLLGWLRHHWMPMTLSLTPAPMLWITQLISQTVHSIVVLVCIAVLLRQLSTALSQTRTALQHAEITAQESHDQATKLAAQTKQLEEAQEQLYDLVSTLETPTVDLADGIVLAPITGALDMRRAHAMTERLLQRVHAAHTRLMVLDLAGMPAADRASIQAIISTASALQLLGCRVVFTSLSSALATDFQQADLALDQFEFARSPQEVLWNRVGQGT